MSQRRIDDIRIETTRPLISPAILIEEIPLSERTAEVVAEGRETARRIVLGEDARLLVVVGPCSIHDPAAAKEYAGRLASVVPAYRNELFIVMRAYFEKPRTIVGWKGYINDPNLDGSRRINHGLRESRQLLADLAEMGMPAATEFLDMTVPQHIADFVSWGAIGARTTESQPHRELASGLSMPVGFKNPTDGRLQTAVEAVLAANQPHWFASNTKDGVAAHFRSRGNDSCHIILRGGSKSGPNYEAKHVHEATQLLERARLTPRVMVDCSHANSGKDPARQAVVAADLAAQIRGGSTSILGVMIESHLIAGRQEARPGEPLVYGQSVTDACLSWDQTEPILAELANAISKR